MGTHGVILLFRGVPMPEAASTRIDVQQAGLTPWKLIQLYSPDEWEDFIVEWTEGFDPPYHSVVRLGGAGDKGRDVIGYAAAPQTDPDWDNYQCKHYDHALRPTDVYTELGKLCVYTFRGDYTVPRGYRFVAPRGVGTKLHDYLKKPDLLRTELYRNWDEYCRKKISDAEEFPLTPDLTKYIDAFDFRRVWFLTPQDILNQHQKTKYWPRRFKLEPPIRPPSSEPPPAVQPHELGYVSCLLDAYADHLGEKSLEVTDLGRSPALDSHFRRSRGYFFSAEALNRFSRDHLQRNAFESVKQDVYDGVVDVTLCDHKDGFQCLLQATQAAASLDLPASDLKPYVAPSDKKGICHHLANDRRIAWVKK